MPSRAHYQPRRGTGEHRGHGPTWTLRQAKLALCSAPRAQDGSRGPAGRWGRRGGNGKGGKGGKDGKHGKTGHHGKHGKVRIVFVLKTPEPGWAVREAPQSDFAS